MLALKSKILIVDDHKENIRALTNLIDSPDYEIHSATNAQDALEILTRHDFSLALLDVQMPEVDGFELARLIRGVKRHKALPVIFVTAQQQDQFVLFEGYGAGAVDLLFKPLVPTIVRSKVRVFVELDKQKRTLESQVEELERLRKDADAANIAKSQFLANMSHEIRTPLAAVMSFAEMITTKQVDEVERLRLSSMIRKNGDLLLRLIDDILDIARIESSKIQMERTTVSLAAILDEVKITLMPKAQEKGVGLKFPVLVPQQGYISDPSRLKQIFLNIVGNAIKFSSIGDVKVDLVVRADETHRASDLITVQVQDYGVGIAQDQQKKLFASFIQGDASTRRVFGGSGLGLMISKSLAQLMGGDVRLLRSIEKEGSVFEITLRLDRSQDVMPEPQIKPQAPSLEGPDFSGKKILVVDDYPENLIITQLFLRSTKADLTLLQSGEEALKYLDNGAHKWDAILMDIQMPKMDGYATTKAIRAFDSETPIIAITAHAGTTEKARCIEAGCNHVLTKPLSRDLLLECLSEYLDNSQESVATI